VQCKSALMPFLSAQMKAFAANLKISYSAAQAYTVFKRLLPLSRFKCICL
jgi:hypothetical protein